MEFYKHISDIVSKASKSRGILMRLNYLPKYILITLYYSLVLPYLFYYIEAWDSTSKSILDPLINAKKKVIRVFDDLKVTETKKYSFKKLSIL